MEMMASYHGNVEILLSTYNPKDYLPALVESLLRQDYPSVHIRVRDDGSTLKGTRDILAEVNKEPNITVEYGPHRGIIDSFFSMLCSVPEDVEFTAFCDQDDIWMEDKLSRAVSLLENKVPKDVPGLYCSRYAITDENLRIMAYSPLPRHGPSFRNALVQNIAAGFTAVLNKAARRLITRELPQVALMHDWWCYLVVSALGRVVYDPYCSVLYRQHSGNAVGEESSPGKRWMHRVARFLRRGRLQPITTQAVEFMRIFGEDLPKAELSVLRHFINRPNTLAQRLVYAVSAPVHRHSLVDNLILRVLIGLNQL